VRRVCVRERLAKFAVQVVETTSGNCTQKKENDNAQKKNRGSRKGLSEEERGSFCDHERPRFGSGGEWRPKAEVHFSLEFYRD